MPKTVEIFDDRVCTLGEGPIWHPEREQLFWFDILEGRLCSRKGGLILEWRFDEYVSAAGWIDRNRLLIASETRLLDFDLTTHEQRHVVFLEAENKNTRSNDGRADPFGGFWISTMGKRSEPGEGSIYRYYKGNLERLFTGLTIPNSICFSRDRKYAYFADTLEQEIMCQKLDEHGWPSGKTEVFRDFKGENYYPDGAVVDSDGCLWSAQWGASRIARYSPNGEFLSEIIFPVGQISCPAFGGIDGTTLFATSASVGLQYPSQDDGKTFQIVTEYFGQHEHQVIL